MTQEVLKLALEFLEDNQDLIEVYERPEYLSMYKAAINKCKEALAQPEQELVAAALFREALAFGLAYGPEIPVHQWDEMREEKVAQLVARLATPPAAQPEQEPVAWQFMNGSNFRKRRPDDFADLDSDGLPYWKPLYTTPPQRKPLTDEEMEDTFIQCGGKWNGDFWKIEDADFHPFLRTIEAKL